MPAGRGRRGRGARVATSLAEINVVPLVDVMLVLLVIFMVTAPMMQQGFNVNLPQARRTDPINAQPVYVTIPADFPQRRFVQIGEEPVRLEVLAERVRQTLLPRDRQIAVHPCRCGGDDAGHVHGHRRAEARRRGEGRPVGPKPVEGRR